MDEAWHGEPENDGYDLLTAALEEAEGEARDEERAKYERLLAEAERVSAGAWTCEGCGKEVDRLVRTTLDDKQGRCDRCLGMIRLIDSANDVLTALHYSDERDCADCGGHAGCFGGCKLAVLAESLLALESKLKEKDDEK